MHGARVLRALSLLLVLCSLAACVSDEFDPGTEGQNPDQLSTTEQALTASCTPAAILAATPLSRRAIIERGLRWVSLRIMYSQVRAFEGYRQDCSGFTSMSWGLPRPGPTTFYLAPAHTTYSHSIGWDELLPGDALNDPSHHVMVFAGWLDARHTAACILQENQTGTPANLSARSRSSISGYHPIRFNHLPPGTSETVRESRCPAHGTATVCLDRDTVIHCNDGYVTERSNCTGATAMCSSAGASAARCVSTTCVASPTETPVAHDVCVGDGRIAHCTAGGLLDAPRACPAMNVCRRDAAGTSRCVIALPAPPTPDTDAGTDPPSDDAGTGDAAPGDDDAGEPTPGDDAGATPDPAPTPGDDAGTGDAAPPHTTCTAGHGGDDAGCTASTDDPTGTQAGESVELHAIYGGCHAAPAGTAPASRSTAALALLAIAAGAVTARRRRRQRAA